MHEEAPRQRYGMSRKGRQQSLGRLFILSSDDKKRRGNIQLHDRAGHCKNSPHKLEMAKHSLCIFSISVGNQPKVRTAYFDPRLFGSLQIQMTEQRKADNRQET